MRRDEVKSHLAQARFSENVLRDFDKVEMAKFSADPYASNRVWECANSARANRLNGKSVWPKMMLPHEQESEMKVTGRFGNIALMDGDKIESLEVLAVTEILKDTYDSKITDVDDIVPRKEGSRKGTRTRYTPKYDDEFPYDPRIDDPEPSGGDWHWIYELEDTSENEIPGASSIKLAVRLDKNAERPRQKETHPMGTRGDSTSTSASSEGDSDVGTGQVVGGGLVERDIKDDEDEENVRELPPDRPFLFHCDPQYLLTPEDIVRVTEKEAPGRFGLLINGILGAQDELGGERRYNFLGMVIFRQIQVPFL